MQTFINFISNPYVAFGLGFVFYSLGDALVLYTMRRHPNFRSRILNGLIFVTTPIQTPAIISEDDGEINYEENDEDDFGQE